jgi:ABC-type enterochelin transport system substrate-binding protein
MIMKRLALLAVTAFVAVLISACGENAERKSETGATNAVQQQGTGTTTGTDTNNQSGQ